MKTSLILSCLLACSPIEPPREVDDSKVYFDFYMEENSGMAYNKEKKLYYIIQDSGNDPEIIVASDEGKLIKRIDLPVDNNDFEDIAYSDGKIYVADIGDNEEEEKYHYIYVVDELTEKITKTIRYSYESGPTNAEGIAVLDGKIYISSKNYDTDAHTLYRLDGLVAVEHFTFQAESVGALSIANNSLFVVIEDDTDKIKFYDYSGALVKVIGDIEEEAKESMEVISEDELIYSAEGLDYFRKVKY